MSNGYYSPGGFSFFPPVLKNLLIINGAVFLLMMMMKNVTIDGEFAYNKIMQYFALMPLDWGYFQIWQLITYQFLHGSFSHIFFNMLMLWMFGMEIEHLWGSRKFLTFYLLCGVGGGLSQLLLSELLTGSSAPTIGASGAIWGVMIAFAFMFPDRYIFLYFLIPVKAKYLIGFFLMLDILAIGDLSGVAYLAHVGGAFSGFLFIIFDKNTSVSFNNIFRSFKKRGDTSYSGYRNSYTGSSYSSRYSTSRDRRIEDANFYELDDEEIITQEDIDQILDKISKSGYQNLTEREKRILFEASKRMK